MATEFFNLAKKTRYIFNVSLITYEDVSKRAKFIRKVVSTHYMPPWKADDHYVDFANNRSLSDQEIAILVAWIDAGTVLEFD